ncbi:MAG: aspartate carbamoyltransferase [Ignavibacteriae bacterium]|nr:MAG: aspartate carbamoyltransferase [Ignavibacteriota bacterium]
MKLQHVIESQQFTLPMLNELFGLADQMGALIGRGGTLDYQHKIMASLFYEPSTRTRFSFESAMLRLGGKIMSTERAQDFSSVSYGESLDDTIRVVAHYADVIVLRHNQIGAVKRAAAISSIPVINAGDGKGGQHPTQALLDLYTIYKETQTIDGVKVALVGNLLDGRTVRSLAYLLGKFERVKIYFVAPTTLQMRQDILEYLNRHHVWYTLESDFLKILPEVDVVYMTRIEEEKMPAASIEKPFKRYFIDEEVMKLMKSDAILMHPLPRLNEISPAVDTDPRAAYFRQTKNGVCIRMALLASVLNP